MAIAWENLSVAGAFLLGAILATIATVRVFRLAVDLVKRERDETT